jgi:T-complex protein 1 subunit alpha
VKQKVHPTIVMAGYRLAMRAAIRKIKSWLVFDSEALGRDVLVNSAKTCLSSKILGAESDLFSNMVVDAVLAVRMENASGAVKYPVSAISILKCHGRSSVESELVDGFALNCTRSAQGMPKQVTNAKIALLGFNLQRHRLQMGVSVVVNDPAELEKIKNKEIAITKERIMKIIESGANVIMTSEGIDDLCAKFMIEKGVMGVRRVKKRDLRHIARATGGRLMLSLADLEGEETVDQEALGDCTEVVEERVGDSHMIYVRGSAMTKATTIVMRGALQGLCLTRWSARCTMHSWS